jgi:hypothetical protein
VADEIARLRAEPGEGDIAIGGATLAQDAAAAGLIDESVRENTTFGSGFHSAAHSRSRSLKPAGSSVSQ